MQVLNKRQHGVPPGAVYVGRPTKWGNPFAISPTCSRALALIKYHQWITAPEQSALLEQARIELAGRDLVCWCAPLNCHADILVSLVEHSAKGGR